MVYITPGPSTQKGTWNRKAGAYEWTQYVNTDLVSPSVGATTIRHVEVDCRFLFEECQWGVLHSGSSGNQHKAGIVHMELVFHQPVGCKLSRARICLTLDEQDASATSKGFRRAPQLVRRASPSKSPVQITDFYGPRYILGPSSLAHVTKAVRFEPNLSVAGNGGGLGSLERETQAIHQSRWKFETYRQPGQNNVLNWEMTEDDINKYPLGKTTVYTAFAYVHSGQPFLMKLKISGELRQRSDRVKEGFKKLFGGFGTSKDTCVTLVEAYVGPRFPLDEEAKRLNAAMVRKNEQETARFSDQGRGPATAPSSSSFSSGGSSRKAGPSVPDEKKPRAAGFQDLSSIMPTPLGDEYDTPEQQEKGQSFFSDTFKAKRAPSAREEEECPLQSLVEAGQYLLGSSRSEQDPLGGGDDSELEGPSSSSSSSISSSTTLVPTAGSRGNSSTPMTTSNDLGDSSVAVEPPDAGDNTGPAGNALSDGRLPKAKEGLWRAGLAWNSSQQVLGLGFLVLLALYVHLLLETRGVPWGLVQMFGKTQTAVDST